MVSLIDWKFFTQMNFALENTGIVLNSAYAKPLKVKEVVRVRVQIEDFVWKYLFIFAEYLPLSVIVGTDFISKSVLVNVLQAQQFSFKFRPEAKILMWVQIKDKVGRYVPRSICFCSWEGMARKVPS